MASTYTRPPENSADAICSGMVSLKPTISDVIVTVSPAISSSYSPESSSASCIDITSAEPIAAMTLPASPLNAGPMAFGCGTASSPSSSQVSSLPRIIISLLLVCSSSTDIRVSTACATCSFSGATTILRTGHLSLRLTFCLALDAASTILRTVSISFSSPVSTRASSTSGQSHMCIDSGLSGSRLCTRFW